MIATTTATTAAVGGLTASVIVPLAVAAVVVGCAVAVGGSDAVGHSGHTGH